MWEKKGFKDRLGKKSNNKIKVKIHTRVYILNIYLRKMENTCKNADNVILFLINVFKIQNEPNKGKN